MVRSSSHSLLFSPMALRRMERRRRRRRRSPRRRFALLLLGGVLLAAPLLPSGSGMRFAHHHQQQRSCRFQQHRSALHMGIGKSIATAMACSSLMLAAQVSHPAPAAAFSQEQARVAELWRTVDRLYVDRSFGGLDWFQLRQDSIKAASKSLSEDDLSKLMSSMVSKLGDKYTRYLPPAKYDTLVQSAAGSLAGIGVQIGLGDSYPIVADVEAGTPAAEASLQAGDVLVQISGESMEGATPDDAAALLRGPEGTKVGVLARRYEGGARARSSTQQDLDLIITRRQFKVTGVKGGVQTVGGKRVAVIRIKSFSETTEGDVKDLLAAARNGGGVDAVVMDLRGNVGGLLPGGINTARLFLPEGSAIVYVYNKEGVVAPYTADATGPEAGTGPILLLVDGNTASASEVMSGALKDNGRAMLVGKQTFGKAVIQTVQPLERAGGGVAVTIARYETPLHKNINGKGIPVDIELDCPLSQEPLQCIPEAALRQ
jgi:carboxyl-terminal processing protease